MSFFFSLLYSPVSLQFFSVCYKGILTITTVFPWLWAEYMEIGGSWKWLPLQESSGMQMDLDMALAPFSSRKESYFYQNPFSRCYVWRKDSWRSVLMTEVGRCRGSQHSTSILQGFFHFLASVFDLTSWPERHYCPNHASIRTNQVLSRLLSGQCGVQMKILPTRSFLHDRLCTITLQAMKAASRTPRCVKCGTSRHAAVLPVDVSL